MKATFIIAGIFLAAIPSGSSASPHEEAVKAVVKAVTQGEDLKAAFPGAISEKEIASLQRVSKCKAHNLMRQAKGRYTVVWYCGRKKDVLTLGMEVLLTDNKVTSISTMEVIRRPALVR